MVRCLPNFTAEESMWVTHHRGWFEIDEDCPEETRKHIEEKILSYGFRFIPPEEHEPIKIK